MVSQKINSIYIIASLRNPEVVTLGNKIREMGIEAFDDWCSPGPEADDWWKTYSEARGQTWKEALNGWAASHVFEFDRHHLARCDAAVLLLPAGRSCGIEFGWKCRTHPCWIVLDRPDRWDVMMKFAYENGGGIADDQEDFIKQLKRYNNAS